MSARASLRTTALSWLTVVLLVSLALCTTGCAKGKNADQNSASPGADQASNLTFTPVDLSGPPADHKSGWAKFSKSVDVASADQGLRCTVHVGSEQAGYGGVRFAATPLRALRLDLELISPEHIEAVYVDGYDSKNQQVLRWRWPISGKMPVKMRGTYTLMPNQPAETFLPLQASDVADLAAIDVFILAFPDKEAGFVLHKVEIAGPPV